VRENTSKIDKKNLAEILQCLSYKSLLTFPGFFVPVCLGKNCEKKILKMN